MSKASTRSLVGATRPGSSASIFDICAMVPILACVYVEIASPLLLYLTTTRAPKGASVKDLLQNVMAPRLDNKIFWPSLGAITLVLVIRNWSRLSLPPHIKCLFAYLALAGTSVLWAFKPDFSVSRFILEMLVVTSLVLPALLAAPTADMMRGVFLCFAFATVLNIPFVLNQNPIILEGGVSIGYPGYFTFKGTLGECAAIAFLLSLYELLYSGWRRTLGIIVIVVAIWLMLVSKSKGSLGLAILAPFLAGFALLIAKKMRISPAVTLLSIPVCYALLSGIIGNLINRISWHLYGNYNLSGRTFIWDFVNFEIARKPLLGWGYQSFWLVGPDAPSVVDGPSWVKGMPSAHNGYLDTMVDMGYVGLAFLVVFIFTTLVAIGRLSDRQPARAWLLLTLALFVIFTNFLETTWMHGVDMMWLIFVIVAAEAGRHWQPVPKRGGAVFAGKRPGLAPASSFNRIGQLENKRT